MDMDIENNENQHSIFFNTSDFMNLYYFEELKKLVKKIRKEIEKYLNKKIPTKIDGIKIFVLQKIKLVLQFHKEGLQQHLCEVSLMLNIFQFF